MCNAHNHPPDCACGWGGTGHLGCGSSSGPPARILSAFLSSHFQTLESFTNPNAQCPECGAEVFFYQSPFGGRVFFDELGPPWPKHPCTDRGLAVTTVNSKQSNRDTGWQKRNWLPVFFTKIDYIDDGIYAIRERDGGSLYFICKRPIGFLTHIDFASKNTDEDINQISFYSRFSDDREDIDYLGNFIYFNNFKNALHGVIRIEKVRSNIYRFIAPNRGASGYFKCNSARLHKPQPDACCLSSESGIDRIILSWELSGNREFSFYQTIEQAVTS